MADWSPEGYVMVGDYEFALPHVPTAEQLEEVEQLVFSQTKFKRLDESERRRNVVHLAIHHASTVDLAIDVTRAKHQLASIDSVPLIGGFAEVTSRLHEGAIVRNYELKENFDGA